MTAMIHRYLHSKDVDDSLEMANSGRLLAPLRLFVTCKPYSDRLHRSTMSSACQAEVDCDLLPTYLLKWELGEPAIAQDRDVAHDYSFGFSLLSYDFHNTVIFDRRTRIQCPMLLHQLPRGYSRAGMRAPEP